MSRVITPFDELRWQQQVEDRLDRLERRLTEQVWYVIGQFGAPIFQNNWTNYGSGYNTCAFMRDANGFVHLRGLIMSGTVATGPTGVIFTLPIGFRPEMRELINVQSASVLGRVDIDNAGAVYAYSGSNVWFSLDSITFKAVV